MPFLPYSTTWTSLPAPLPPIRFAILAFESYFTGFDSSTPSNNTLAYWATNKPFFACWFQTHNDAKQTEMTNGKSFPSAYGHKELLPAPEDFANW